MRGLFINMTTVLVLAVCSNAQAQLQAEAAFKMGIEHFKANRYKEAAAAFREANELKSNWKIQYNIGQSEAAAKRHGLALEAFEQYLAEGGDEVPHGRRDEVLAEVKRLRAMVGSLEVRAPTGCLVSVDNVERGLTPLAGTLMVAAGVEHSVLVKQQDKTILERVIRLSGGQSVVVEAKEEVVIPAEDQPVAAHTEKDVGDRTDTDEDKKKSTYRTAGWVTLCAGAAMLVGASVTGGLALSMNSKLKEDCGDGSCIKGERQDDEDKRDSIATISSVLFGVGGAAAAAGVVVLVLGYVDKEQAENEEADGAEVAFKPSVGPSFLGVAIQGRF